MNGGRDKTDFVVPRTDEPLPIVATVEKCGVLPRADLQVVVSAARRCVVCGIRAPRTKQAKYCEECHTGCKPYSVEYAVTRAIRRGELKPVRECVCVDCGAPAKHYDHRDYNKPLEVEPVCVRCNLKRGPAIRYGKTADGKPILRAKA